MPKFPKSVLVVLAVGVGNLVIGVNSPDMTISAISMVTGFLCLAIFGKEMNGWCNQRADAVEWKAILDEC